MVCKRVFIKSLIAYVTTVSRKIKCPGRHRQPGHPLLNTFFLQWLYVYCGRSLLALFDIKANSLTLVQCLEAFALNGTEMNENISAFIVLDKAEPFFLIKPLYLTFCQSFTPPFPKIYPSGFRILQP